MKFDNIRLLVTHFDECFKFYHEKLGFPVLWGELGGRLRQFWNSQSRILCYLPAHRNGASCRYGSFAVIC